MTKRDHTKAKSFSRYIIRRKDPDELTGGYPYWCGGHIKDWVPGRAFATVYTQKQRDFMDSNKDVPSRGEWLLVGPGEDAFLDKYKVFMMQRIKSDPNWAMHDLGDVDEYARTIVSRLKTGDAEVRDVAKEVAREFGIPATIRSIQTFLNTPPAS